MSFNRQPQAIAQLNRRSSLIRGLAWAHLPGVGNGFFDPDNTDPIKDSMLRVRGAWQNGVSSAEYQLHNQSGKGITGESLFARNLGFAEVNGVNTIRNFTRGCSMAGIYIPTAGTILETLWLRRKQNQFVSAGCSLGIGTLAPLHHHWTISDGASQLVLDSTTTIVVGVPNFVVGTWDGTTSKIYIDGRLENTNVPGFQPTNPAASEGINWNASNTFNAEEGIVTMGAYWTRGLTEDEVRRLYSDNYIMWRHQLGNGAMFGPGMPVNGGGLGLSIGSCCCPGPT